MLIFEIIIRIAKNSNILYKLNILQSIILGIIQGITEFFPISSSGHLVIVPFFFGWDYPPLYFTVTVHFATLLAVLSVLYRDVWRIIRAVVLGIFRKKWRSVYEFKTGLYIILATIPAALVGYFLDDAIEGIFFKAPGGGRIPPPYGIYIMG